MRGEPQEAMAAGIQGRPPDGDCARYAGGTWPRWGRLAVSAFLLFHMAAIAAGGVGAPPSSTMQRRAANWFRPYFSFINQGYGYRYYARLDTTVDPADPRPWSTPVVTLVMEFDREGAKARREEIRLPGRSKLWPNLRHQRQLDLAYHLSADPRWAASFARHLCKTRGCARVAVYSQEHRIPDLQEVRHAAAHGEPVDLEAETTYSPRRKLGEFRCGDF